MSDGFGKKEIEYVARLARMKISDADKSYLASDLDEILRYVRKLNELDTEGVKPLSHVLPLENVWREDEAKASLPVDEALANAPPPRNEEGFFIVPKVIE